MFQSVGQVHADDADSGINGEIYFSLMEAHGGSSSSFAVDPVTGVISLTRPLSYHKKKRHKITVLAQDRGAKSRFATRNPDMATVHLSVRQVKICKFLISLYQTFIQVNFCQNDFYALFFKQPKCILVLGVRK